MRQPLPKLGAPRKRLVFQEDIRADPVAKFATLGADVASVVDELRILTKHNKELQARHDRAIGVLTSLATVDASGADPKKTVELILAILKGEK